MDRRSACQLALVLLGTGCVLLDAEDRSFWYDRTRVELELVLAPGQEALLFGVGSLWLTVRGEQDEWQQQLDWEGWWDPGLSVDIVAPGEEVVLVVEGHSGHTPDPGFLLLRGESAPLTLQGGQRVRQRIFAAPVEVMIPFSALSPPSFGAALASDGLGNFYIFGGSEYGASDAGGAQASDAILAWSLAPPGESFELRQVASMPAAFDDTGLGSHGGRMNHSATLISMGNAEDLGKILVAGGWQAYERSDTVTGQLLLFDPSGEEEPEVIGELRHPRACHTAVALDSGEVIFFGGYGLSAAGGLSCERSIELYDPWRREVELVAEDMEDCLVGGAGASIGTRALHCGGLVWGEGENEGKISAHARCYLAGQEGSLTEAPSPTSGLFGLLQPSMARLEGQDALLSGGGKAWRYYDILAGQADEWIEGTDRAWIYRGQDDSWEALGPGHRMEQVRASHSSATLPGGRVLVAGGAELLTNLGMNVSEGHASAEIYNASSDSWKMLENADGTEVFASQLHMAGAATDPAYGVLLHGGLFHSSSHEQRALFVPSPD